jgi:inositol transport system substrate-binding protein
MSQSRALGVLLVIMVSVTSLMTVGHTQEKKLRIVYSSPSLEFSWLAVAAKTAKEEAQKLNVELIVQDGQGSSPKQSSDLRNAVSQGVDGIVLDPNDVRALTAAVNDVLESGIPVVSFDRYVEGASKPVPFFCLDNVAGAAALAQYVIDKFPNGAKIVFITGKPGGSAAIDRAKGVHDTIKAAGEKYKIVAEQTANWARSESLTVTQNVLTSLGYAPDAIIAANDDMALGAIEALQQMGIPARKILVLGIDGLPEALVKIRDGEMAGSVQFPVAQVRMALDSLVSYLREKKPIEGKLLTPVVIEQSNLQEADRYAEMR